MSGRALVIVGLAGFATILFVAIASLFVAGPAGVPLALPDAVHLFGTDGSGRDLLGASLMGTVTTLAIAGLATLAGLLLGGTLGLATARAPLSIRAGPHALWQGVGAVVIALVLTVVVAPGIGNLLIALSVAASLGCGLAIRDEMRRLRRLPFYEAARAAGMAELPALQRHLLPRLLPFLARLGLTQLALLTLLEVTLSFAGLGVSAPVLSLGGMISGAQSVLVLRPAVALVPAGLALLIVLSLHVAAAGLRPGPPAGSPRHAAA